MVWPIAAIIVAVALLAVPVAIRSKLPKMRPTENWVSVGSEVVEHDAKSGAKPGQVWPVVRYATPGRDGQVETSAGLPIKAEKLPLGTQTDVLVDPLNPVLPFVASQWARTMQVIKIVTYVCIGLAAALVIYGVVMLLTQ